MSTPAPSRVQPDRFRPIALAAVVAALLLASATTLQLLPLQPAGFDFSCFWAGGRVASQSSARIYDFALITAVQGLPVEPGQLRPYIYPPSALPLFAPLGALPYWPAYGLWVLATGALFLWAALRAGAPWWTLAMPVVALVAYCGQVTFLIGGLVLAGLALGRRPLAAGVLFGLAAAIKPQLVLFLPLALLAEGRWRTILATGTTGLALVAVSAALWGIQTWFDWLAALPRFQHEVIFANPELVADAVTPYAALVRAGLPGGWAFLLAPLAAVLVWVVFRRTAYLPDRLIAVFGAAILVSPYAMNYEAALFAPAVAAYMARIGDRLWIVYLLLACLYAAGLSLGVVPILAVLALPLIRLIEGRLALATAT